MLRSAFHKRRSHGRICQSFLMQAACILLVMGYPGTSPGAIFACPSGDTTIFQDRPCPIEKQAETVTRQTHRYPLSIDESWFDLPEKANERAFCDRKGCECGRLERKHQNSLAQAVADALYLDGSWHRYESSYNAWLDSPTGSAQAFEARNQMLEASCEIMMSQTLLRKFGDDVMKSLAKRVRTAEERGFDVEQPCLDGVADACAFFDSVQLRGRLQKDAAALRTARGAEYTSYK